MLAAHRMVVGVRTLIDSWDSTRPTHVRLRAGGFQIAMRKSSHQLVTVELSSDGGGDLTATSLTIAEAALPILKLASDLLRSLVSSDRGQSRNLRVRALRQEVRALRREIRARRSADSFVNLDPDRLRIHNSGDPEETEAPSRLPSLQFDERWAHLSRRARREFGVHVRRSFGDRDPDPCRRRVPRRRQGAVGASWRGVDDLDGRVGVDPPVGRW